MMNLHMNLDLVSHFDERVTVESYNRIADLYDELYNSFADNKRAYITGNFINDDGDAFDALTFFVTAGWSRDGMRYVTDGTFVVNLDEILKVIHSHIED